MEGTGASDSIAREAVCSGDELELGCFPLQWTVRMGREEKARICGARYKLTVFPLGVNHVTI